MKKTIITIALSLIAASAFAQQVSASAVASDVSSPYINSEEVSAPSVDSQDVSAPYISAMGCCSVSNPVSATAVAGRVSSPQKEDDSGMISMAGLGFGLFGLVGVSKLARRKKQK